MSGKIKEAWDDYAERVMSPHAGENQRVETERAFYAGAWTLLNLILGGLDGDSEEMNADEEAYLQSLTDELEAYAQRVAHGEMN